MISTAITTVSDLLGTTDGASVDELTAGMHVVAHRIGYQHHGIYIGDGQVVAYLLDTGVTVCSWSTFADGDKVTVYEHDDALYAAEEIVQRALDRVGEDDYNLVFNNCEHFANWCITGQAKSYQVREVAIETTALAAVAALALHHAQTAVRVGSACHCHHRRRGQWCCRSHRLSRSCGTGSCRCCYRCRWSYLVQSFVRRRGQGHYQRCL